MADESVEADKHRDGTLRAALLGGVIVLAFVVIAVVAFLAIAGPDRAPRSAEGAFEGSVSRVWQDGMTLEVDGGATVRLDTWSVCGDRTASNIAVGDELRVYADRDLLSYEAWQILDPSGEPAC